MTQLATPSFVATNIERALPGISEADAAIMADLASAAQQLNGDQLQTALDSTTYAPNSTSGWGKGPAPERVSDQDWRAYGAARAAVASNVAYRLSPSADTTAALKGDQIYTGRDHLSQVSPGDKDRFRQAGSAMLWTVARHLNGQPTRRRADSDTGTPWGFTLVGFSGRDKGYQG